MDIHDPEPVVTRAVARELRALFEVDLAEEHDGLEALAIAFGEAVAAMPRAAERTALVAALSTDRLEPFAGVVHDLAEILALPREQRSEYLASTAPAGPWVFSKLLLEYALWSAWVDATAGRIIGPFCATRCDDPPVGCCFLLGYDMDLVSDGFLRVQALEAAIAGWTLPPDADRDRCRYHTPTGCVLRLFKTPACLQYVCPPLREALRWELGEGPTEALCDALHALGATLIDREEVFGKLQRVVDSTPSGRG